MRSSQVLQEGSMVIGRGPDAGWTISDSTRVISKRHCLVEARPDGFSITDISTNGTYLNDQPVGYQTTRQLADGDIIRLGSIVITARIEDGELGEEKPADQMLADGPFGDDKPLVGPAPVQPTSATTGPIGKNWWKEPPSVPAPVKPESMVNGAAAAGARTVPTAADAIVISLVQSFPNLDVATFAQAVDLAGGIIGEPEWRAFHERLRTYLRERYQEDA